MLGYYNIFNFILEVIASLKFKLAIFLLLQVGVVHYSKDFGKVIETYPVK